MFLSFFFPIGSTDIPQTAATLTEDSLIENEQVPKTPTPFDYKTQVKSKPDQENHVNEREVNEFGRTDGSNVCQLITIIIDNNLFVLGP